MIPLSARTELIRALEKLYRAGPSRFDQEDATRMLRWMAVILRNPHAEEDGKLGPGVLPPMQKVAALRAVAAPPPLPSPAAHVDASLPSPRPNTNTAARGVGESPWTHPHDVVSRVYNLQPIKSRHRAIGAGLRVPGILDGGALYIESAGVYLQFSLCIRIRLSVNADRPSSGGHRHRCCTAKPERGCGMGE